MKDNSMKFLEHSQFDSDDFLGLIHVDQFVPRPIKVYPEGYFSRRLYFAGVYVGSSYRVKATFDSFDDLLNFKSEYDLKCDDLRDQFFYSVVTIHVASI